MIYLLAQLAAWLLLTFAFAALAGWSFAAWRTAADDAKARRDRHGLVRDLTALVGEGGSADDSIELEREREASRRLADVRDGRITELEHALEAARASANESAARGAELQRALDAMEAEREQAAAEAVDVEHEPVAAMAPAEPVEPEDDPALQTWRLRYLEQRVRYLENGGGDAPEEEAPPPAPVVAEAPLAEWRARVAEARAAHAENEVRVLMAPPPEEETAEEEQASPFAANADVDVLLRWRMLYLERRVAHMQARAAAAQAPQAAPAPEPAPVADLAPVEAGPDPDRWKWRARYLESRARHMEQRLAEADARPPTIVHIAAPAPAPEAEDEAPAPAPPPAARRAKPPVLQAPRHGAPDDFTLIDGVSLLQQTTLYSLGVFHYDQVAAWSDEHVAWIDNYLRLRGRIDDEEWREQASALSREGPVAARRLLTEEV